MDCRSDVAPPSRRLSGGRPARRRRAGCPPGQPARRRRYTERSDAMLRRWQSIRASRLSGREGWAARWRWNCRRAGYRISAIVSGNSAASRRKGQALARRVHARWSAPDTLFDADLVWFCVPDREIALAARQLGKLVEWKGRIALHSSGALASDELQVLRRRGAAVASVHPLMTFVRGSVPSLRGVPFALEGDPAAVRVARQDCARPGRGNVFHFEEQEAGLSRVGSVHFSAADCLAGDRRKEWRARPAFRALKPAGR